MELLLSLTTTTSRGGPGGVVLDALPLSVEPFSLLASTRKSYVRFANRPGTTAEVASAAAVTPPFHDRPISRCSTSKPSSSDELSVQDTLTPSGVSCVSIRPEGAAGSGGKSSTAATLLGVESPFPFAAKTLNS